MHWAPDSNTKCGCDVHIKSLHDEEFSYKWVGSLINWYNPNCEAILSIVLPSKLVLSCLCHVLDFALKFPMVVIRNGFFCTRISKVISKLSEKFSNSSWDWLRDLWRTTKLQVLPPTLSSRVRHSFK